MCDLYMDFLSSMDIHLKCALFSPDFLSKSQVEAFIQKNLTQEDYEILYRELHSIPPPPNGGSYGISGIQLWLLTGSMRSWTELAWGLYRSHLDNALKQARLEILQDEGEKGYLGNVNVYVIPSLIYYILIVL